MQRKVNRVGVNTLTVSLPSKWAKKHAIKAGDELSLSEDGAQLILSRSPHASTGKATTVTLDLEEIRSIRSFIGRLYILGYDLITINFQSKEQFAAIKKTVNDLIGADIVDSGEHSCQIKVFPGFVEFSQVNTYIVKMLLTIKEMFNQFNQINEETQSILAEYRIQNWKIRDYILRSVIKQNIHSDQLVLLTIILFSYEKISRKIFYFLTNLLESENQKKIIKMISEEKKNMTIVTELIDFLIKSVSTKEFSTQDELKYRKTLRKKKKELFKAMTKNKKNTLLISFLYSTIESLEATTSSICLMKKS